MKARSYLAGFLITFVLVTTLIASGSTAGASDTTESGPAITDEELWAAAPELLGERRSALCSLGYLGSGCVVTFAPKLVGPHEVLARSTYCRRETDSSSCKYSSWQAWYDVDPARYFTLGPGLLLDEALPVARAYFTRQLMTGASQWPGAKTWKGFSNPEIRLLSVSRSALGFSLTFAMCGCSAEIRVVPTGGASAPQFQVTDEKVTCY